MRFHVMTLFPDMISAGLGTSITGRAIENHIFELNIVNIRDYSKDKHKHVDDYPYGGGAGMVMQPGPVYDCYQDIVKDMKKKAQGDLYDAPGESVQSVHCGGAFQRGGVDLSLRSLRGH